jgi:hypothetical protein
MKFLSSWGTTEYLRLFAILICATAIVAGFLRRRKKLHGQDLLRWLLLTGAVMGLLTWEIFRDNDWLGPFVCDLFPAKAARGDTAASTLDRTAARPRK